MWCYIPVHSDIPSHTEYNVPVHTVAYRHTLSHTVPYRHTVPGRYMAVTWPLHGRYMAVALPLHGRCMAVTGPLHDRYMTVTWPLYGRYAAVTGPLDATAGPRRSRSMFAGDAPFAAHVFERANTAAGHAALCQTFPNPLK